MKPCKECGEPTSNKKYCSRECQYNSYKNEQKAERVERVCDYCEEKFTIKKSDVKYNRGKYCSRQCQDKHKKETYKDENNPMYGKTTSEKQKNAVRKTAKHLWENRREEIIEKITKAKREHKKENGKCPGWTEEAREKRKETFIENYGKEHNWKGEYGKRQCDKTTVEKYGKTSHEMMIEAGIEAQSNKDTRIENTVENILQENSIEYETQIWIEDFKPDFYLPNYDLIIEADGDYWHGNPEKYDELDEIQERTKEKDKRKEEYFAQSEYELERFWGSEIRSKGFESELINTIHSYE